MYPRVLKLDFHHLKPLNLVLREGPSVHLNFFWSLIDIIKRKQVYVSQEWANYNLRATAAFCAACEDFKDIIRKTINFFFVFNQILGHCFQRSLIFRNENQEIRNRFKMKTLFLAILYFWVLKSRNPRQIQSEDLFVKDYFILGTKIKKSEADLK